PSSKLLPYTTLFRSGRTGVEAAPAAAAMILLARLGRDLQRRQNRAEKQPRTERTRHQIGVLALPADTGFLRQRLLHHRRGVDERSEEHTSELQSLRH